MPATLPWPKIPKQPSMKRCSCESRLEYCACRNATIAWATVRRRVMERFSFSEERGTGDKLAAGGAENTSRKSHESLSAYWRGVRGGCLGGYLPWSCSFGVAGRFLRQRTNGNRGSVSFQVDFSQT